MKFLRFSQELTKPQQWPILLEIPKTIFSRRYFLHLSYSFLSLRLSHVVLFRKVIDYSGIILTPTARGSSRRQPFWAVVGVGWGAGAAGGRACTGIVVARSQRNQLARFAKKSRVILNVSGARAVNMGSGTVRYGNGKPREISFRNGISRPFPSVVSVPTVYCPAVRCLVPVPSVDHPAFCSITDCFPSHSLASCSHPILTSHTVSPVSHLDTGAPTSNAFTAISILFPSYDHRVCK